MESRRATEHGLLIERRRFLCGLSLGERRWRSFGWWRLQGWCHVTPAAFHGTQRRRQFFGHLERQIGCRGTNTRVVVRLSQERGRFRDVRVVDVRAGAEIPHVLLVRVYPAR